MAERIWRILAILLLSAVESLQQENSSNAPASSNEGNSVNQGLIAATCIFALLFLAACLILVIILRQRFIDYGKPTTHSKTKRYGGEKTHGQGEGLRDNNYTRSICSTTEKVLVDAGVQTGCDDADGESGDYANIPALETPRRGQYDNVDDDGEENPYVLPTPLDSLNSTATFEAYENLREPEPSRDAGKPPALYDSPPNDDVPDTYFLERNPASILQRSKDRARKSFTVSAKDANSSHTPTKPPRNRRRSTGCEQSGIYQELPACKRRLGNGLDDMDLGDNDVALVIPKSRDSILLYKDLRKFEGIPLQANMSYSDNEDEGSAEPFATTNMNSALTKLNLVNSSVSATRNTDQPTTRSEIQMSAVYANFPATVDQPGSDYEDAVEVIDDVDQRVGTPQADMKQLVSAPTIYENMRESESAIYMNMSSQST